MGAAGGGDGWGGGGEWDGRRDVGVGGGPLTASHFLLLQLRPTAKARLPPPMTFLRRVTVSLGPFSELPPSSQTTADCFWKQWPPISHEISTSQGLRQPCLLLKTIQVQPTRHPLTHPGPSGFLRSAMGAGGGGRLRPAGPPTVSVHRPRGTLPCSGLPLPCTPRALDTCLGGPCQSRPFLFGGD